ncbi:MAG: membrane lipoprotein lipid attachment site-containing protein [Alistipes sp.]|nr:membrane lipoprotein lipid attachment site-containing protein [Alistipes sp.]
MKRIIFMAVALLVATACSKSNVEEMRHDRLSKDKIYATIADVDTRVVLNSKLNTVWNVEDEIVVVNKDGISHWQYDSSDKSRSGSFSCIEEIATDLSAIEFDDMSVAVYAAKSPYYQNNLGKLHFISEVAALQKYEVDSYASGINTMVANSSDATYYSFKNVLGYLRLAIKGDKSVESIVLRGNDNEPLAGEFTVSALDVKKWGWSESAQGQNITLDCGSEGVKLDESASTYFYFVLPPMTFDNGFTVVINFTDDSSVEHSTSKKVVIERNTLQPMSVIDISGGEVTTQFVKIYHSGTTISAPVLTGTDDLAGYIYWGDDNQSALGAVASYTYDDGVDTHVIEIVATDAETISVESCKGISQIDLSNF